MTVYRAEDLRIGCGACGNELHACTCPPRPAHSDDLMFDGKCPCDECVGMREDEDGEDEDGT